MDEDDTQHRADLMARAVLMAVAPLTGVVALMAVVLLVTGCAVVIVPVDAPEQVKRAVTAAPLDGSTTQDGDSKNATLSIQAQRPKR
ncbi:MAG: hypothetical protein EBT18_11765 [Gammaproteobacteria bacterium]|nr:hypothetical protein [Gammaproteobacteria bacterium]